jgi:endoglucanase Acf2
VSAWNAVALWAQARGDAALEERARWMLAMEAEAAQRLWLEPDLEAFPEYAHDIVAIEWGAKRDYATWFSADPAAMLGIQLIPVAPFADQYLEAVDPEIAERSIVAATGGRFNSLFGDYLLMYAATAGAIAPSVAWNEALALPDSAIDDGDSRTYLLAYLAALES